VGRIRRGWELTKQSWAVVKRDRSLMVFPVVAGLGGLVLAVLFGGGGYALYDSTGSEPAMIAVLVVGAYFVILVSVFCNVALSSCAARSLEGRDTTPSEGFTAARARFGPIAGWSLLALVVGGLISVVQSLLREGAGQLVAALVGGLANMAWSVATFFVVPVIALEGLGPGGSLKRSLSVVRERWGEGVAGSFAIGGLIFLLAFLPGAALFALGVAISSSVPLLAAVLIVLGIAVFVIGAVVQTALMAIFKVALYRFATEDRVLADYTREAMETAFRPKRRGLATA
jgi:hypothetical protein